MKTFAIIFLMMVTIQAIAGGVKCQIDNSCPGMDVIQPSPYTPPVACVQYTRAQAYELTKNFCQPRYGGYLDLKSVSNNKYVWSVEYELCGTWDVVIITDDQCNITGTEISK